MDLTLCICFFFALLLTSGSCSDYRERSRIDNPGPFDKNQGGDRLLHEIDNVARRAPAYPKDNVNVKQIGKYTFITELVGKNKYICVCLKGKSKVWAGMCGVADRHFNYKDCI